MGFPVEFEGADGAESGEDRVEDLEVEEVAHVGPDTDEGDEVGDREAGVEVVEDFGGLRKGMIVSNLVKFGRSTERLLTARKKSLMSCVMYTAIPM